MKMLSKNLKTRVADLRGGDGFAGQHVHLIGVGGCGMRALTSMLMGSGAVVSGSDMVGGGAIDRLVENGAKISVGQRAENIPEQCDLVVYSAAIHQQNPELLAARQRGLHVVKYSRMLGMMMAGRTGIAIAGTHGKSTTTAMVAYALSAGGADPSFIVGATVDQLGGPSGAGTGEHFVVEACEFDRSFLNLQPDIAAILNIEEDHLDCFGDLDAIVEAFRAFACRIRADGVLIANGEERAVIAATESAACEVQTFGLAEGCTWRGAGVTADRGCCSMEVHFDGRKFCRVSMAIPGLHNAYNALAAVGILHQAGMAADDIATHLGNFAGARRRSTLKAAGEITVVDDYAHHPTEVQATLRAIRDHFAPGRLICVFQPHQHSRTRFLLKDFARSFALADEVIVPDIYFVRDSRREKDHVSSADLVAQIRLHGGAATYIDTFDRIIAHLQEELGEGDLLVTMGAGDVWKVADGIIQWLGTSRHYE